MKLLIIGKRLFKISHLISEIDIYEILRYRGSFKLFFLAKNPISLETTRQIAKQRSVHQLTSIESALKQLPPGEHSGYIVDIFLNIIITNKNVKIASMHCQESSAHLLDDLIIQATNQTIWNGYTILRLMNYMLIPVIISIILLILFKYYNLITYLSVILLG